MSQQRVSESSVFEDLRKGWLEAAAAGRLEEALALTERAWEWAKEEGESRLADLAYCNRAALRIELGLASDDITELRKILMRNGDGETCWLAAYHIARAYDLQKEYKKALFYARIARDRSETLDRTDWLAASHNQIGNLLLAESFFDDACREYDEALKLLEPGNGVTQALILENVGYCRIVQKRHGEGLRLLYQSLRTLRRAGARRYQTWPHLSLCYAHLELGRYREAERHGRAALRLAEEFQMGDCVKNALYLLGEVANLQGNGAAARNHFQRLQRDFYPEAGFLPDFLLAIDVRGLVNLKA